MLVCSSAHVASTPALGLPEPLADSVDLERRFGASMSDDAVNIVSSVFPEFLQASFDAVTNVYLMHELPPEVRTRILAEIARVVRPDGLVVVADSLQGGQG